MSNVIPLWESEMPLDGLDPQPSLVLENLALEEQFVIWVLRNWLNGTGRWSRLSAGVRTYIGAADSADALRAFGDMMLCLKYNGRHPFTAGAPGCPLTVDELALLALVAACQNEDRQLTEGLVAWLARPAAQKVLAVSVATFSALLSRHSLCLPCRSVTNAAELRDVG